MRSGPALYTVISMAVISMAVISMLGASSCSSHFNSSKTENFGGAQLTAQQKKDQVAKLSTELSGVWSCSGTACMGETLTFNSALDGLTIDNHWRFCQMHTDYQLTMGIEDADGITDFSIHANGLGALAGTSATNEDCKSYLAGFSNKPLDENFSFSHSDDWTQITVDDNNFTKNPTPQVSITPAPSPLAPSTQLPNS